LAVSVAAAAEAFCNLKVAYLSDVGVHEEKIAVVQFNVSCISG